MDADLEDLKSKGHGGFFYSGESCAKISAGLRSI